MSIPYTKTPPCGGGGRPAWACDKFFQCSLVNSDVLLSAPTEVENGAEEILAAFFYEVPAEAGGKNLGLVLACADLTLYAVVAGLPNPFTALKQVCLPYGGVADVAASGIGGSVLWSDQSIQRILQYDRLGPNDVEPHMMRYSRYVRYLATPSFAEMPATKQEERKLLTQGRADAKGREVGVQTGAERTPNAQRPTPNAQLETGKIKVIREGEALSFDGKPYTFGGRSRWRNVLRMLAAHGDYVKCDKGLKALFANNTEASAFFETAIEAEGRGRNGTRCYRLKT